MDDFLLDDGASLNDGSVTTVDERDEGIDPSAEQPSALSQKAGELLSTALDSTGIQAGDKFTAGQHSITPVPTEVTYEESEIREIDPTTLDIDIPESIKPVEVNGDGELRFMVGNAEEGWIVDDLEVAKGFASETEIEGSTGLLGDIREAASNIVNPDLAVAAMKAGGVMMGAEAMLGSETAEAAELPDNFDKLPESVQNAILLDMGMERGDIQSGQLDDGGPAMPTLEERAEGATPEMRATAEENQFANARSDVIEAEIRERQAVLEAEQQRIEAERQAELVETQREAHEALQLQQELAEKEALELSKPLEGGNLTQGQINELAELSHRFGDEWTDERLDQLEDGLKGQVFTTGEYAGDNAYETYGEDKEGLLGGTISPLAEMRELLDGDGDLDLPKEIELNGKTIELTEKDQERFQERLAELEAQDNNAVVDIVPNGMTSDNDFLDVRKTAEVHGLEDALEAADKAGIALTPSEEFTIIETELSSTLEKAEDILFERKEPVFPESPLMDDVAEERLSQPPKNSPMQSGGELSAKQVDQLAEVLEGFGDQWTEDKLEYLEKVIEITGDKPNDGEPFYIPSDIGQLKDNLQSLKEAIGEDGDLDLQDVIRVAHEKGFLDQRDVDINSIDIKNVENRTVALDAEGAEDIDLPGKGQYFSDVWEATEVHGLKDALSAADKEDVDMKPIDEVRLVLKAFKDAVENTADIIEDDYQPKTYESSSLRGGSSGDRGR